MNMNHLRTYALGIAAALVSLPTYASMQAQSQNLNLVSVNAELTQALNSKSTREAEQSVTAKLTDAVKTNGDVELPKGTMLTGKVAEVQNANSNGKQHGNQHRVQRSSVVEWSRSSHQSDAPGCLSASSHRCSRRRRFLHDCSAASYSQ